MTTMPKSRPKMTLELAFVRKRPIIIMIPKKLTTLFSEIVLLNNKREVKTVQSRVMLAFLAILLVFRWTMDAQTILFYKYSVGRGDTKMYLHIYTHF